jgi:hypothetical protein
MDTIESHSSGVNAEASDLREFGPMASLPSGPPAPMVSLFPQDNSTVTSSSRHVAAPSCRNLARDPKVSLLSPAIVSAGLSPPVPRCP